MKKPQSIERRQVPERIGDDLKLQLALLGKRYLAELRRTSRTMEKSGLKIETFEYAECKPIIDEIDLVLAQCYGFTEEEVDFIVNYDIKYRMGVDTEEEQE